ncbi:MAG: hypothetical protein Q9160_004985 [Pyrenula sp. 1 TL-2023]
MSTSTKAESMLFDRDGEFWKNYKAGRPIIPPSFYQRFFDYHEHKGGSFETAYDVGAGFGELALNLSKRFSHVIVGDPAPNSLSVAQELIKAANTNGPHFTFRQERIEESDLPAASVDAIFCGNMIQWTDVETAMAVVTRQLKPGGTLFISLSGIPKYDARIQPTWWKMVDACVANLVVRMPHIDFDRLFAVQDNGYDSVAVPEGDFEVGVVRLKLNTFGDPKAFIQAPESSRNAKRVSRVGSNDSIQEGIDKDWFFDVDIDDMKATLGSYPLDPDPEMLKGHLSELDALLAGGKCEGHWPVSIIMATRRKPAA